MQPAHHPAVLVHGHRAHGDRTPQQLGGDRTGPAGPGLPPFPGSPPPTSAPRCGGRPGSRSCCHRRIPLSPGPARPRQGRGDARRRSRPKPPAAARPRGIIGWFFLGLCMAAAVSLDPGLAKSRSRGKMPGRCPGVLHVQLIRAGFRGQRTGDKGFYGPGALDRTAVVPYKYSFD